jgi:hypothetical protein
VIECASREQLIFASDRSRRSEIIERACRESIDQTDWSLQSTGISRSGTRPPVIDPGSKILFAFETSLIKRQTLFRPARCNLSVSFITYISRPPSTAFC